MATVTIELKYRSVALYALTVDANVCDEYTLHSPQWRGAWGRGVIATFTNERPRCCGGGVGQYPPQTSTVLLCNVTSALGVPCGTPALVQPTLKCLIQSTYKFATLDAAIVY